MEERPFINARTDKPDKGLVRQVMRELAVFQGQVSFVCAWLGKEINKLTEDIDFSSINALDVMDRDLISELLGDNDL